MPSQPIYQFTVSEELPEKISLTPLRRSMIDFELMLDSESHGNFFRSVETIEALFSESKALQKKLQWLYFGSFIGAILILSGPLPDGLNWSFGGASLSLAILPQQLIALATAVAYGMYITHFGSFIILSQMVQMILLREGSESWHYFSARFDSSTLWAAPLMPKTIGYRSPRRHTVVSVILALIPLLSVSLHSITIVGAIGLSTYEAFQSSNWLLYFAGAMSAVVALASALGLVGLMFVKMPFRRYNEAVTASASYKPTA